MKIRYWCNVQDCENAVSKMDHLICIECFKKYLEIKGLLSKEDELSRQKVEKILSKNKK